MEDNPTFEVAPPTMEQRIQAMMDHFQRELDAKMMAVESHLVGMATNVGANNVASSSQAPAVGRVLPVLDANMAKLLDLKPPSWNGKGDLERNFILPWKDYLAYTGISNSAPGLVAKIFSSCPPYLQDALRAKRTLMLNQGELFPEDALGLFDLMLKTRPPMDKMRLSLTRLTVNKVNGFKLLEYNQQFLSNLNDIASLTVEQLQSFLYVQGLTGEVRKEVEAKMDWKTQSYSTIMDYATQVHSRLRGVAVVKDASGPSPMELGAVGTVVPPRQKKGLNNVQCHLCKEFGHYKVNCPKRHAK